MGFFGWQWILRKAQSHSPFWNPHYRNQESYEQYLPDAFELESLTNAEDGQAVAKKSIDFPLRFRLQVLLPIRLLYLSHSVLCFLWGWISLIIGILTCDIQSMLYCADLVKYPLILSFFIFDSWGFWKTSERIRKFSPLTYESIFGDNGIGMVHVWIHHFLTFILIWSSSGGSWFVWIYCLGEVSTGLDLWVWIQTVDSKTKSPILLDISKILHVLNAIRWILLITVQIWDFMFGMVHWFRSFWMIVAAFCLRHQWIGYIRPILLLTLSLWTMKNKVHWKHKKRKYLDRLKS